MIRVAYGIAGLLVGILGGLMFADAMRPPTEASGPIVAWLLIIFGGLFGGLLYGMRERGLVIPAQRQDPETGLIVFDPGWLVDCAFGFGGGFVIFLLLPGQLASNSAWDLIKVLATAIVGGYGGRSVIDRMLAQVQKTAEEAKAHAVAAKQEMDQLKQEQQAREETEKLDGRALILVERQLTGDQESPPVDDATLRDAIRAASPETRRLIFYKAKEMRSENWRDNKARVERTIPVFRALIESDPEKKFHRNYAQVAYALKDKSEPDAKTALELLNQAIQIRDSRGETNWLFYEFNRALCRIMLDPQSQAGEKSSAAIRQAILADLQTAAGNDYILRRVIPREPLSKDWLARNGVKPAELRAAPP